MKFNWGTGIAIFYSIFVITMVGMVVKSFYHQSHLVEEDYYQLDLDYEAYRQKRENATNHQPVLANYDQQSNTLKLKFPESMDEVTGTVFLFRPSDKNLDNHYNLVVGDDYIASIAFDEQLLKGLWYVKIDWQSNGSSFFKKIDLKV